MELSEAKASVLTLSEDSPVEQFEITRSMLDAIKDRVRELDEQWRSAALARCVEHGEMTLMGHRRFYAGIDREIKCRDVRKAIESIYEATDGDFDALVGCLSVNALKPGATRKVIPAENFNDAFETVEKTKLNSAVVKGKSLIETDDRFVK